MTDETPAHGVNVPLLRKTLEHITEHPDQHNQSVWMIAADTSCGTAGCLAGWAATLAGHTVDTMTGRVPALSLERFLTEHGEDFWTGWGSEQVAAASVARVELGLDEFAAYSLFDADNSRAKLWRTSAQLTHGEIAAPDADTVDPPAPGGES